MLLPSETCTFSSAAEEYRFSFTWCQSLLCFLIPPQKYFVWLLYGTLVTEALLVWSDEAITVFIACLNFQIACFIFTRKDLFFNQVQLRIATFENVMYYSLLILKRGLGEDPEKGYKYFPKVLLKMAILFKMASANNQNQNEVFLYKYYINCVFFLYFKKTDLLNPLITTSTVFLPLNSTFAICPLLGEHFSLGLTKSMFKITLESTACFC